MHLLSIVSALALALLGLLGAGAPAALAARPAAQAADQAALEEQNKARVTRIYTDLLNQDETDLVSEVFSDEMVQHDARAGDGVAGQLALFESLKAAMPGMVATIKHTAADGDLVAVHWHASASPEDEFTGQAVVDLWRLADGKVVEHWDVFQGVPAQTASGNSMFSDVYTAPQGAPTVGEDQEEANRQLVVGAYTELFNNRKLELLDQVWDPRYFQHNPRVPNGTAALGGFVSSLPTGFGPLVNITQALADGDLVFTIADRGGSNVLADIFRVVDGKIIEHWDVVPAPPAASVLR